MGNFLLFWTGKLNLTGKTVPAKRICRGISGVNVRVGSQDWKLRKEDDLIVYQSRISERQLGLDSTTEESVYPVIFKIYR